MYPCIFRRARSSCVVTPFPRSHGLHRGMTMEDNPFVGCTMVVTGKVEPYTRSGINAKIESLGAVAGSSVTKKTDYLICGENAGSKLDKARALGIRVLSPGEFFRMIGE